MRFGVEVSWRWNMRASRASQLLRTRRRLRNPSDSWTRDAAFDPHSGCAALMCSKGVVVVPLIDMPLALLRGSEFPSSCELCEACG